VKPLSIDDTFLHDHVPPTIYPPLEDILHLSDQDLAEMKAMYKQQYAPGLDSFFETTWYSMQGEDHIQANNEISQFLKYCVDRFKSPPQQQEEYETLPSLEARLVWLLATIPRYAPTDPLNEQVNELLPRISTIEHLLTGTFLPESQIPPPPPPTQAIPPPDSPAYPTYLCISFWHHLGRFTSINDSTTSSSIISTPLTAISQALSSMRAILSMLENRDVLYSMAIARHYGGRAREYRPHGVLVPSSQDPEDPFQKLLVAMRFLTAQESAGTTQIVQRFCGMVRCSWWRGRGDRYRDVEPIHEPSQQIKEEQNPLAITELPNGHEVDQQTEAEEEQNPLLQPDEQKQETPSLDSLPEKGHQWSDHVGFEGFSGVEADLAEGVRAMHAESAEHRTESALPNGIESN